MLLAAAAWMMRALTRAAPDEYAAAQLQGAYHLLVLHYPIWFMLHLLLAGVVPIAFAALLWLSRHPGSLPRWLPLTAFLAALSGSIIGRALVFVGVGPRQTF